jgi:hypothetical protein
MPQFIQATVNRASGNEFPSPDNAADFIQADNLTGISGK